jgi:transcriptional regulator with XRE-family HTH domain
MDAVVSLYRLREQRGLTQVDLAKELEVTQDNVSRVDNAADLYVYVWTLARYVRALGGRLELTTFFPTKSYR